MKIQRLWMVSIFLFLTGPATAQQLLMITSPNDVELFGQSVAALPNGNVVVGAIFVNPLASGAGRVYVFDPDGCNAVEGTCDEPVLRIDSPNPSDADFGAHTATTPNGNILVGSLSRVLVFDGSATGTTDQPERIIEMGQLDGGSAVRAVGATPGGDIVIGMNSGRVFVFSGSDADSAVRLTIIPPDADGSNLSVHSLAVSDDRIVVGTRSEEGGRVLLFDSTGAGTNDTPLLAIDDPTTGFLENGFAETVAVTPGGDVVVGARLEGTGTVYLFEGDATGTTSTPILTLKNPDNFAADGFGNDVAASAGGHIIVGADVDLLSDDARDAGSAYVFDPATCDSVVSSESGWPNSAAGDGVCEVAEITINNPSPGPRDLFGKSVASGPNGTVIVGAPQDETGGASKGNVFLFEGPDLDDDGNSGCLTGLQTNILDPGNLIIVRTSLVDYMRCAGLIPRRPVAERLCFPDCYDDPMCHDDGCPFPFMSITIDPLILESIELVKSQEIDEATFNETIRASLASNRTTLTFQPASEPSATLPRWVYISLALLLVAALFVALRLRSSRR